MSELQQLIDEFTNGPILKHEVLTTLCELLIADREPTEKKEPNEWQEALDARIESEAQAGPFESRAERETEEVGKQWNALLGIRKIRAITPKRRKLLQKRLSERSWDWKAAMAHFPLQCFQDDGWRPGFDWFLREDTVNKILEGNYDWEK